jgi:hypothetical protein
MKQSYKRCWPISQAEHMSEDFIRSGVVSPSPGETLPSQPHDEIPLTTQQSIEKTAVSNRQTSTSQCSPVHPATLSLPKRSPAASARAASSCPSNVEARPLSSTAQARPSIPLGKKGEERRDYTIVSKINKGTLTPCSPKAWSPQPPSLVPPKQAHVPPTLTEALHQPPDEPQLPVETVPG